MFNYGFKDDEKRFKDLDHGITPIYEKDITEAVSFVLSRPASVNTTELEITIKRKKQNNILDP